MSNEACYDDRPLERVPLVTLYLSERCNSRCTTCDYWRNGRADMTLQQVARLAPALHALGTDMVLISGGEPLLNREWREIVALLRARGIATWLLTSGLSLAKHARAVARLFDRVTVSLDGACRRTYAAIRGVDAFDGVLAGIRAAATAGAPVSVRVTVQRGNFRELPALIEVARAAGASQISFLAVDVANPHAFARSASDERKSSAPARAFFADAALRSAELSELAAILSRLESERAADFESGFIAETPQKLARILAYFTAVCGLGPYPPVRCNAPEFSAVIDAQGRVQPCFFIPGPELAQSRLPEGADLVRVLDEPAMRALRTDIRCGRRSECARCVCSMWRDPGDAGIGALLRAPRPPGALGAAVRA